MTRLWIGLTALVSFALPGGADDHLVVLVRREAHYNFGLVVPAAENRVEYWLGADRMAVLEGARRQIVETAGPSLRLVDDSERSVVILPLPFDPARSADPDLLAYMARDAASGSLRPTGIEKSAGNLKTREYRLDFRSEVDGSRMEEREGTIGISPGPPLSAAYRLWRTAVGSILGEVAHWDDSLVRNLGELPGFPVRCDIRVHIKGRSHGVRAELAEFSEGPPPSSAYLIPADYSVKTVLDLDAFNAVAARGDWGVFVP